MDIRSPVALCALVCGCAASSKEPFVSFPGRTAPTTSAPAGKSAMPSTGSETELVPIPGTPVAFHVPAGFVPASEQSGLVNERTESSLVVTVLEGSFKEVTAGFSKPELMAEFGTVVESLEERPMGELAGVFLSGARTDLPVKVLIRTWAFGNDLQTILLTGNCVATEHLPVLEAALFSAELRPDGGIYPFGELGFELADNAGLRLDRRTANMLMYVGDEAPVEGFIPRPLFVVGPGSYRGTDNLEAAAETIMAAMRTIIDLEIQSMEPIHIDGLDGYEGIGRARDRQSHREVSVYQTVLFDAGQRYWTSAGLCPLTLQEKYVPRFKQMAASFRRLPETDD